MHGWTSDDFASAGAVIGVLVLHAIAFNVLTRDQSLLYILMIAIGVVAGGLLFAAIGRALGRPKSAAN